MNKSIIVFLSLLFVLIGCSNREYEISPCAKEAVKYINKYYDNGVHGIADPLIKIILIVEKLEKRIEKLETPNVK